MRKKAKSITWKDRQRIELLLKVELPVTQIAADIGVTRGAIYQEITRGGQPYSADLAQQNVCAYTYEKPASIYRVERKTIREIMSSGSQCWKDCEKSIADICRRIARKRIASRLAWAKAGKKLPCIPVRKRKA